MANVADTLAEWSSTSSSNAPSGATTIGTTLDDDLREIQGVIVRGLSHKGSDIASVAGTTDIGAVEGLMHDITGTETITGYGTVRAGLLKVLKFEGAASVTHNATSMILLGGASRTMANGDVQIVISEGSGNWRELAYFAAANGPSKVLQAAQATTSGTTKDFTIPAWAKKVTVMLNGVGTDGTEELLVQLGDTDGIENTGYLSSAGRIATTNPTGATSTAGFILDTSGANDAPISGSLILTLMNASTFTWVAQGCFDRNNLAAIFTGGSKSLSAALTTVRLTTTGTPDDFDAGSVAVLVE